MSSGKVATSAACPVSPPSPSRPCNGQRGDRAASFQDTASPSELEDTALPGPAEGGWWWLMALRVRDSSAQSGGVPPAAAGNKGCCPQGALGPSGLLYVPQWGIPDILASTRDWHLSRRKVSEPPPPFQGVVLPAGIAGFWELGFAGHKGSMQHRGAAPFGKV